MRDYHGAVADWTDGPEYAPSTRPAVFVAPQVGPLDEDDPAPAPRSPDSPVEAPDYTGPTSAVPLDGLAPPKGPERDPLEPFSVVSLTTGPSLPHGAESATPTPAPAPGTWGAVHASGAPPPSAPWAPTQPLAPSGVTAAPAPPGPGQVPAPPAGWPAPAEGWPPPEQVPSPPGRPGPPGEPIALNVADLVRAVTPGVLITLAVGGLVGGLSLPLLWVAQALASRITHRRSTVARVFTVASAGSLGLGLASVYLSMGGFDLYTWFSRSLEWGQLACWVVLVVVCVVVALALRRGDPPDMR